MASNIPLISIIVTNYNYEKYVAECIKSVVNQSYANKEVIIIDDGSTDKSLKVIKDTVKSFPDTEIQLISQPNLGVIKSRNKGISIARGDFIIFIDADDFIPRDFIESLYDTAKSTKADVVYCDLDLLGKLDGTIVVKDQSVDNLIEFMPTPVCQLIRKKVIGEVKFDKNLANLAHEDNDFFFNLYTKGAKFSKCKKTRYRYRIHGGGRSPLKSTDKHYRARMYIYKKYREFDNKIENAPIDILVRKDSEISKWHTVADQRLGLIESRDGYISDLNRQIEDLKKCIDDITNSKKYKLMNIITNPVRLIRKIGGNK